jgi:exodeoxyribonuclease V beta subunit
MPDGVELKLSQVEHKDRINEFEFDFNMSEFDVKSIAYALPNIEVRINTELESIKGVMNGKMDLFFRHNNKYYILDWKSNFLGFTIEDYNIFGIEEAMADSNYHLQYIIYTMAARLYLSNRIPNFEYESQFGGVVYLFLRGVRKNLSTGIYTNKPTLETLDSIASLVHHEIII